MDNTKMQPTAIDLSSREWPELPTGHTKLIYTPCKARAVTYGVVCQKENEREAVMKLFNQVQRLMVEAQERRGGDIIIDDHIESSGDSLIFKCVNGEIKAVQERRVTYRESQINWYFADEFLKFRAEDLAETQ